MGRPRNHGVVYGGKVGAKMRPPRPRKRPVVMDKVLVLGGPLAGRTIKLESFTGGTLPFTVGGRTGHIDAAGTWYGN